MSLAATPEYFDKPTAIWLPFAKIDKATRMVYGFASTEALDAEGETVDLDAIAEALPGYMKFANIREMHGNSAVGKAKDAAIMTKGDKKGLYLGAKIVDDAAWNKVLEEVYLGFSVGGKKLEKVGNKVTKIHLSEISIVDRPANPDCTFDQVAKRHPLVERDPAVDASLAKAAQKDFKVQTLIFDKSKFKVAGAAQSWAKKNGFESGDVDGTGGSFRLRQFDPAMCKADSHRTFELTDGVQAVGCTVKGVDKMAKLDGARLILATMSLDLMKAEMDKGGPGSGPHPGGGSAADHLKQMHEHEQKAKEHLRQAGVHAKNGHTEGAVESYRRAREEQTRATYQHQEAVQQQIKDSRKDSFEKTDTSSNAPGGNAGRKVAKSDVEKGGPGSGPQKGGGKGSQGKEQKIQSLKDKLSTLNDRYDANEKDPNGTEEKATAINDQIADVHDHIASLVSGFHDTRSNEPGESDSSGKRTTKFSKTDTSSVEKGGPGSGPHAGAGRDNSQRMPETGRRFDPERAKLVTEKWTREQHVNAKEEHLQDANRAKVVENREKIRAQTESDRSARDEHMKNFQSAKDAAYHHQEAAAFHANAAREKTKVEKGTDISNNAPGVNAGRKEDCTMPGMTKEAMDAHKADHATIGKELAEMAEAHKDDATMSAAIKEAMTKHDEIGKLFGKAEEPEPEPGEGSHQEPDEASKKLAGIKAHLEEMGAAHKNAAGDPKSNKDWKNAAEMIGNLAKAVGIVNDKVDTLRKGTPAPAKTRSFGKADDVQPELLAKVEGAAVKAEADKDVTGLLKLVHSHALGGVTRN